MRGPRFVLPCFPAAFLQRGWWCRKSESYSSYALRGADVWAVQTNIVSCSDVTISLLAQSRASRVTGLTPSFVAQSLTAVAARRYADGSPLGATLFRHDPFGRRTLAVEDLDLDGEIGWCGPDRIVSNDVRHVLLDGDWWRETSAWQARADGSPALSRVSATRTRLTGLGAADGPGGVLVAETRTLDARGRATVARTRLDRATHTVTRTSVADPLANAVTAAYDAEGRVVSVRGAAYPVDYAYDAYGNRVSMTTYRDESLADGDVTRWLYDEPSGCMTNKVYADGRGPVCDYTPDGRLARRTWARGVVAGYAYDGAGQLVSTAYSDGTPAVAMSYDRVGNLTAATTAGVVTNLYAYDLCGLCTNEWQNGFRLTRHYDALGRPTGYSIDGERQTAVAYDAVGRVAAMQVPAPASDGGLFAWSYLPDTDLKASLACPNGLTASWAYDASGRLAQVRNAASTNVVSQFDYAYDAAGRRVSVARGGTAFGDLSGSVDAYAYNARGELVRARRTKGGAAVQGFSEDFGYDPVGNRRTSATHDERGEALTSTYVANALNQYVSRTTPGHAAVRGEADPDAAVTVNGNPAFRLGSYYFGGDLFDNSASGGLACLETYAALARTAPDGADADDLVSSVTGRVYVAQSPEAFAYDADGNQTLATTRTGRWRVEYDGENRPVRWTREGDGKTVAMSFDHMGRRRTKGGQRFFYDGNKNVSEVAPPFRVKHPYPGFSGMTCLDSPRIPSNRWLKFMSGHRRRRSGLFGDAP